MQSANLLPNELFFLLVVDGVPKVMMTCRKYVNDDRNVGRLPTLFSSQDGIVVANNVQGRLEDVALGIVEERRSAFHVDATITGHQG